MAVPKYYVCMPPGRKEKKGLVKWNNCQQEHSPKLMNAVPVSMMVSTTFEQAGLKTSPIVPQALWLNPWGTLRTK